MYARMECGFFLYSNNSNKCVIGARVTRASRERSEIDFDVAYKTLIRLHRWQIRRHRTRVPPNRSSNFLGPARCAPDLSAHIPPETREVNTRVRILKRHL